MHATVVALAILNLLAAPAWAQSGTSQSVTIPLASGQTEPELQALATAVRIVAGISKPSIDTANRAFTLSGTAEQLELARALIAELDQPSLAPLPDNSAGRQYLIPDGGEHLARVFYLRHAATPRAHQEVMTLIRGMEDIHTIYPYWPRRAFVMRGTGQQFKLATWLINEVDRPAGRQTPSGVRQYPLPGSDELIRLFFLNPAQTPYQSEEKVVAVMKQTKPNRVFYSSSPPIIAVRGTAKQIQLAEQAISALP